MTFCLRILAFQSPFQKNEFLITQKPYVKTPNTRVMKNITRKLSAKYFILAYFEDSTQIYSYFIRYVIEMKENF